MFVHKNAEGYPDPTVGEAMSNIAQEERRKEADRLAAISALIPVMKGCAELVGFEVVGRIVLMDKETGKTEGGRSQWSMTAKLQSLSAITERA